MRKFYLTLSCLAVAATTALFLIANNRSPKENSFPIGTENSELNKKEKGDEHDKYDGPELAAMLEFEKTKDPALGYVPYDRLLDAMNYTEQLKQNAAARLTQTATVINWQERGPIFDSVGPSANSRAGNSYTSGRMCAILVDTLNDPSGNTVFVGGVAGGVWKCTNFLSTIPNWQPINDWFSNLAVSYICQDPTNPSIMYFSTGEPTSNADAVLGAGVWKSTDAGTTWAQLPSTTNIIRTWKIICDNSGNVYLAARPTTAPAVNTSGLLRSTNGGATWTNITPTLVGTATATATCTDIELSSTGKLYASFGYSTGGATTVRPYVTTTPSTVTQATGWILGTGIRTTANAGRLELACLADTVYGLTTNSAANADSCYKSVNGGLTWAKTNSALIPAGLGSGQTWYNLTLSVNPSNSHELMGGGLDAYRSTNDGATWTRATYWVSTSPYVHADHHFQQWWNSGGQNRMIIGNDGGVFYSTNSGVSWVDKNRNLGLKQFYAGEIHPGFGSPYLLAGAQDNGVHAIRTPGKTYSFEVYGGDGCFVHINQQDPNIQYGSYVYNVYRRSINGGQTWTSVSPSTTVGMFVNPFDYDDFTNTMYASFGTDNILRWPNANISNTSNTLTLAGTGNPSCFKVSPHGTNRVFFGTTGGRLYRLNNANTATPGSLANDLKNITGSSFPTSFMNCIAVGSTDDYLVAVYTGYGVNSIWYSSNGGTSWTSIEGNLPDMPVRWAVINPSDNNKISLATETGVWHTDMVNGSSTVWAPDPTFPVVRTDMLHIRLSDNTMVAATHGRGLYTGQLTPPSPEVRILHPYKIVKEATSGSNSCRRYTDYNVDVSMIAPVTGNATVTYNLQTTGAPSMEGITAAGPAIEGVDFEYTTNGDFNNISHEHVFPDGFSGVKTITVRVYDDVEAESSEMFTIGLTLSGSSNAIPGVSEYMRKHTMVINDNNDNQPPFTFSVGNYSIGTYNVDVNATSAFAGNRIRHRMQALYTAAELQAAGLTGVSNINSLAFKITTKNSTKPYTGFTISMANSTLTTLSAGFTAPVASFSQVWTGDYSSVTGSNLFNFATPFQWDGLSNVIVQVCFDNGTAPADTASDRAEGNSAPLGTGVRGSTYSNYTTGTTAGCSLNAAFVSDSRINIIFNASRGHIIATALNTSRTEYFGPNKDFYFVTNNFSQSPQGEILGRVLSLSNHDYGCTQILIDRAGTGASQFWNSNPANYLMNKTYKIIPTTNNPNGRYEVTFYFTKEEKEGWEAATGQTWDKIQIIKLPSGINNVTPTITQPDGPGTIKVIDAVKRTFGTGYTLSGIFDNGFSAFGFGVPGRMNTILTLSGQINANKRDIDLDWTTSVEVNSSIFEVEKSYDGTNFHRIGVVQAAGDKLTSSNYSFVDGENVQSNYYRIKMQHTDGYVLYSNTIFIGKNDAPQRLFVYPNPFLSHLSIRLARIPTTTLTISIFDAAGKLVKRYTQPPGSSSYPIDTKSIISRGIYMLRVNVDGGELVTRIMKE
jgi:trimeric autotransporter adhesin